MEGLRLGYRCSPEGSGFEEISLSMSELLAGIGIFGEHASDTGKLIVASAFELGCDCLVLDFWNRHANLASRVPEAQILEPGSNLWLSPFRTEGLRAHDYCEILLDAIAQANRLSLQEQRLVREYLLDAYEQVGRTLDIRSAKVALEAFLEDKERVAVGRTLQTIRGALSPMLWGRTAQVFAGPPTGAELFSGLKVVELGNFADYTFRSLLQALILAKLYCHARTRSSGKRLVVLIDGAEHLFPDRSRLPADVRQQRFLHRLAELRTMGIAFILCSELPTELDRACLTLVGTKVVQRFSRDLRPWLGYDLPLKPEALDSRQALLLPAYGERWIRLTLDRPAWLFLEAPTREEATPFPRACQLEVDFGKDAPSAYALLKAVSQYNDVTRKALANLFAHLPRDRFRQLLGKLEELAYIRSELEDGRFVLSISAKGERALREFESSQSKVDSRG